MLLCPETINTSGDENSHLRDHEGRGIFLDTACEAYFTVLKGWKLLSQ